MLDDPASKNDDGTAWFGAPVRELRPLDPDRAGEELAELSERAEGEDCPRVADLLRSESPLARFLGAVFDLSPYLRDCARNGPQALEALFDQPVEARLETINEAIAAIALAKDASESGVMRDLRRLKREAHFLIALADRAGADDAAATVARLSTLAETCVRATVNFLLRDAHRQGKLRLPDPDKPEAGCGWIVLAMGKLGARELNFSSDIDLIVLLDPQAPAVLDPLEAPDLFVRLTRRLVRILQDRTGDGYVFRTDLRLRPDPGSTPLAIPLEAALNYYESRGQNWERAAMIKAHPIAGDLEAGNSFLRELQPYVWRKYLDYAAIADVHSIKRQIHAHKGHGEIAVLGHNIKLGRGGIREIEFFVQTQQLIAGGRFPELRGRMTVSMLRELADRSWISDEAGEALIAQYWFLRDVENVIQMIADEQAHTLPADEEGLERVGRLLGYEDGAALAEAFRKALHLVESHYAALFETAPQLSRGIGNLVFTGDVDDPGTLATLSELGFERPSDICRVIRGWHFGRYRATQSAQARGRLTELTPALLEAFGSTQRADEALLRFDEFLSGLPAGVQLFSLLQSNPRILDLLASIMGAAPRLAAIITRRPHVFDGLLDPALLSELPKKAYLTERLETFLGGARAFEDLLDRLRIFAAEQKFLIGMRLLTGSIDAERAGKAFSDLADLTIGAAFDAVEAEFAQTHGRVPGGRTAIVGMGKLGSRELTAGSDVDLILLYDHAPDAEESDGRRALAPSHYYSRLTQRLIAAMSAPTAEGVLYELDLRLRPSGNKGPVATHIEAFRKYQRSDAWTWEHMALTRARVVAGDSSLCEEAHREIEEIVALSRDREKVAHDVVEMRALLETEKPAKSAWDLKLAPGGIIDLEFIAQAGVLQGFHQKGPRPTETTEVLAGLAPEFVDEQTRGELVEAHRLYSTLTQIIRLCLTGAFDPDDVPPGLADILLRTVDLPELTVLKAHVEETEGRVRGHFDRLLRKG
ncbi:bifunctional [glutamine synthetase] adenylyltransferase/[glutamine synthetase]-adenylyl-L-tyrosine phosphorylase [Chelativorans sp. YIM 93263]|uniref:bifunctional [glutamine synthetase] adenylyltransferase/[glutamine synthetase]-adenylyl-L-tyrosine phosphorylase n=1 Tax=Chelativorans sp. YIM 93263 TaxID=2906648 RepID=UPI002378E00E|nr:bifunctional [glutamine synthetase] adenylyltransferase/[glutamine synthetase]-adenylyl-L-tyrosine phosphorylase [Chelativorans sp. YIM 93263]